MKFKHFERKNGTTTDTAKIEAASDIFGDDAAIGYDLECTPLRLTIKDGEIKISSYNNVATENDSIKELLSIDKVHWENGFEFIDYFDDNGEPVTLVADKNSDVFNAVTGAQNMANLKNIENVLKNALKKSI